MNYYEITMQPRDVLFFRGAKPMEASVMGEGARWPMPSVFHHTLLSAFHQTWPKVYQPWEHEHRYGNDKNKKSSFRFGGLNTIGVFPCKDKKLYLPMPADITTIKHEGSLLKGSLLKPEKIEGFGDLPKPLALALHNYGKPTKDTLPSWIDMQSYQAYLQGDLKPLNDNMLKLKELKLYDTEPRPGIAIDSETASTEEGKFYLAEYMRLREDISITGFAFWSQGGNRDNRDVDVLETFFSRERSPWVTMGGQQGTIQLQGKKVASVLGEFEDQQNNTVENGHKIKWVLLTPAVFTGGWLPSWIHPDNGEVILYEKPPRTEGESRTDWRKRINDGEMKQTVLGILKAARIPKPLFYSGWRSHGGNGNCGPKPTRLCVPAGAVYYFETPQGSVQGELIGYLNAQCKSDIGAEKGFGFGSCGIWT